MGKKDGIMTEYYGDRERYADLLNVCVFHGRQVISPEEVQEKDSRTIGFRGTPHHRAPIQKYRDMIRGIVKGMNVILVALEHQDQVHYAMPVRVMMDDAAGYDEQMREIQRKHHWSKDLKGAEFLGRFSRKDKIRPIVTLVLYYGKEPWDGPRDLHEMMEMESIPEELQSLVNHYPIHIIEIQTFPDVDLFQTDLREVFGFFQRSEDKHAVQQFVEERKAQFERLAEDAYDMITVLTNTKEFVDKKERYREEGSGINMCRAIKELIEDGKQEGLREGKLEGLREGKLEGKREGEQEGLLKGTQRINELNRRLLADGRQDDMIRAVQDAEYQKGLLHEYGFIE